jgi:hypothetical protein
VSETSLDSSEYEFQSNPSEDRSEEIQSAPGQSYLTPFRDHPIIVRINSFGGIGGNTAPAMITEWSGGEQSIK